jgi:hypothetical protein
MQHLEGSGTPVLYIGRTILKGQFVIQEVLIVRLPSFSLLTFTV